MPHGGRGVSGTRGSGPGTTQPGEVDLLSPTTWAFQRDVQLGFDFVAISFYDGQLHGAATHECARDARARRRQPGGASVSSAPPANFGRMLGVDKRWAYNIVRQIGNYAEIFARTIAPMGVERGVNRQWRDGGRRYAPPLR